MNTGETGVILIVDDNPTNLGVISDFLDDNGFEVRVARDGESALQKVEYDPPDLILLDVMMPGIDGFETCLRLKSSPTTPDIPVIFMTALSDSVDKVKGLNLGAVDYITKPFQQDEVLARVKVQLKLHFLTQTLAEQNARLKREIEERSAAENALHKLTIELENRVEERTAELSNSLYELKKTQTQLIQSEKMASIGQLAAGVAHEINNPLGFILGNLGYIEEYTHDLLEHLQLYQTYCCDRVPEISTHAKEIELDYLSEDLPQMVSSMKLGIDRIRNISVSLRNFSRSDTSATVSVNIHEGIESTLLILTHRLKANPERPAIEVIKEYGDLPSVECYPAQMNQVFMNILANAIDALEAHGEWNIGNRDEKHLSSPHAERPTIRIRTEVKDNSVVIRIADNGSGMTEEVSERAFNPMFTTKPMGKGTGLGLSISRQIVEDKHQGSLTSKSNIGQGTEFAIAIPIQQPS